MNIEHIKSVYFVGVGGIGMSAIARYFLSRGVFVAGYDKTPSTLTQRLQEEGAEIHYEDDLTRIPTCCQDPSTTLVIYTPAIPAQHTELCFFQERGFDVQKRAQVLGTLTRTLSGVCVAGTHGKTTTSTMTAHLLNQSHVGCNAFLGGISKNYGTNYILSPTSEYVVIEADEYDRSFHWLTPKYSVITSADPDHLDIYGTEEAYMASFKKYTSLIQPGGALVMRKGLKVDVDLQEGVAYYEYSRTEGDFRAENVRIENGEIYFNYVSPLGNINNIQLGVPISINIENGIAAMALAQLSGATAEEIRVAMGNFAGIDRRFDFTLKSEKRVLLSDYAHHPSEIEQCARSLRELYPTRRITAAFQPHLYSRTNDFYKEFAAALSLFDEVILTDIYPARELPIEGVSSQLIYDQLSEKVAKHLCKKEEVVELISQQTIDVLVILGAGDIESYMPTLTKLLEA